MPGRRRQTYRRPHPSPAAVQPPSAHSRWWNRATKSIVTAIVTLGAVAGAVSTVVSLWPSPDADDSAEVTVRIVPGIPLSEYQHRMESTGTISLKGYSPPDDSPPDDEIIPEPTARAEPTETTSPARTELPDPTGTPASTRLAPDPTSESAGTPTAAPVSAFKEGRPTEKVSDAPPTNTPSASSEVAVIADNSVNTADVDAVEDAYVNLTGQSAVPSDFIAIGNAVTPSGEPVEPAVAAERIAKVLTDARHAPSAADPAIPDPEPLGVVVSTDLDLSGLRGEALTLSWSMWQERGGVRLSGDWLNDNLAYRIEPRTDHATTTLDVWIPMPREPGSYFVRVDLRHGRTRIDSGESERFE